MGTMEQIEQILDREVRPMLHNHGGEVRITNYQDGVLSITLQGACAGCPAADLSTRSFVEATLIEALPEIKSVKLTQSVSEELLNAAKMLLGHDRRASVP